MGDMENNKKNGTACRIPSEKSPIKFIKEGQLCPNCGFARLIREPGPIIKCPVCGYGNTAGCT